MEVGDDDGLDFVSQVSIFGTFTCQVPFEQQHLLSVSSTDTIYAKMQRPAYSSIPPAQSPPLHHPVPQHVSTVPQLRSPPPPSSQNSYGYGPSPGAPGQPQAGVNGYNMHPAFGGFMEDPTAKMAASFAGQGLSAGQQYMEQNVSTAKPNYTTRSYTDTLSLSSTAT